jgi:hypothetical protein
VQRQNGAKQFMSQQSVVSVRLLPQLNEERVEVDVPVTDEAPAPSRTVKRIACFCSTILALILIMNTVITSGLRRIRTSAFGTVNRVMKGDVNADIVITGSSRALVQYDPRTIASVTGHSAFNLGRNGSQTDMQVAFFKAYLEHNSKPKIVLHNLDAFTFVTTREVFDPAQYMPYIDDPALYNELSKINPDTWKSRYLPLYGYVVEDMNFAWITGLGGFLGWNPPEDYFLGFNPRHRSWGSDFQKFKASNPHGVSFGIESAGIRDLEDMIQTCRQNQVQLILVYSPEYSEMQAITNDRAQVFGLFHQLAERYHVPLWDYSNWEFGGNRDFFYNSQHLNATGAAYFSGDIANRLKNYLASDSNDRSGQ